MESKQQISQLLMVRLKEGSFILLSALALFLLISLWSYSSQDPWHGNR
ncbi:MAG: DNA translocase FtsK 4TM domain-containing protein [Enterobacterales bacterium]|nr:DNA translocase FtsK 4TM domain-containing protein [Enterobacterales bacterium]